MSFTEVFINAEHAARDNFRIDEGDYIGEDGLYRCGVCRKKKETIVTLGGEDRKVACICDCREAELAKEKADKEERERKERIKAMRRSCFGDEKLYNWTFANDKGSNPKQTAAVKKYADDFEEFKKDGIGLLLWGSCGTGKTYAACALANALIDKGISAKVTNFGRILNELQGTFDKQPYLDELNRYSLLVIDDLGIERTSEFSAEQMYGVIDNRYKSGLPLIITTNLDLHEMTKTNDIRYKRIYERILEVCHPIEFEGVNYRRKNIVASYDDINKKLGL